MLTVVDWYASHKQTYTATMDLYNILKLVVPPGTTVGTFNQLRGILDRHRLEVCQVYDACKRLRHRYFRTVWDVTPDQHFALVRFDEY